MTRVVRAVRVGGAAALLLLAVAALPWLRGEDPATSVLRARFRARGDDAAAVADLRNRLRVPDDPFTATWQWLHRAVRGDLGVSWRSGDPVVDSVGPALQVSVSLASVALATALAVAALLVARPVWRATRHGGPLPRRTGAASSVLASLPEVVVGSVLVLVVAVWWRALPAIGWAGPASVVLPALALGLPAGGLLARLVTGVVDQALAEPWTTSWRVNGVGRLPLLRSLLRRIVGQLGAQAVVVLVTVIGAAVAVEQVFNLPGAGSLALHAALAQDLPVLQGCLAGFLAVGLVAAGLAALAQRVLVGPARIHGSAAPLRLPEPPRTRAWLVAIGLLGALVVAGLPRDGGRSDLTDRLAAPSLDHPLGADAVGHDVLGRLAQGTVLTLGLAVATTVVAFGVALAVGLPARREGLGVTDVWVTVPSTVVGIAVASATGPGLGGACLAVLLVAWVPLAVHARTLAVDAWAAGHVQAATLAGSTTLRTLRRHVLPAVAVPLVRHALVRIPAVALGLAGLSFLGLGADPDAAELGAILADGVRYLERAPWLVGGPALVLVLLGTIAGTAPNGPRR